MKFRNIAALLALSTTLSACVSGDDSTPADSKPTAGFQAQFNTTFGILPFPNDLYFNGSKTGELNLPGDPTVAANGPLLEMNHLDGYGTQSDIKVYFTAPVDKTTLTAANIAVLKVTSDPTTKAVTGFVKQLHQNQDYSVTLSPASDSDDLVVDITPLHPLDPSTIDAATSTPVPSTYLVIITRGVKATDGSNAEPSAEFQSIIAADTDANGAPVTSAAKIKLAPTDPLFPVAAFTLAQLTVANAVGAKPAAVALTFSFSTEYLGVALGEIAVNATATTQPAGVGIVDTGLDVCHALALGGQLPDSKPATCATVPGSTATEVFAGTVALPYYLTVPAKGSTAALTDSWHNAKGGDIRLDASNTSSFIPKATVAQNVIPILVALPITGGPCTMPGSGWPVVVFQHGITRNREDMLAIASGFGGSCVGVIAIDLPLHGVTNTADALYLKGFERTFDMDADGKAGAASANIAGSGSFFINLTSTITSRDNLREGAADLINLVATLPNLAAVTPSHLNVNTFDSSNVFFVGHSLGGIVGTTFLGADSEAAALTASAPRIKTATLAMPGGHIAKLLTDSPSFAPQINQGLADEGLATGSQAYYDFLNEAQAVVEDGDPANYAGIAAAPTIGHPIHMIEVVGNGGSNSPDKVVPNSATQVLIDVMGLATVTATKVDPAGVRGVVQFTAGDHGSILDPTASAAATTEMQTETVVFVTGVPAIPLPGVGETILISDNTVVKH